MRGLFCGCCGVKWKRKESSGFGGGGNGLIQIKLDYIVANKEATSELLSWCSLEATTKNGCEGEISLSTLGGCCLTLQQRHNGKCDGRG